EASRVEPERRVRAAVTRDGLVHDSAPGAGEVVLGPLRGVREVVELDRAAGQIQQRKAARDFQGRRRAQASADRDVAGNHQVRAGHATLKGSRYAYLLTI